jgi:hypothetical protein
MNIKMRKRTAEYQAVAKYYREKIQMAESMRATGLPRMTIWRWAKVGIIRYTWIRNELNRPTMLMNKADVLYCAAVHKQQSGQEGAAGKRLFDRLGLPYQSSCIKEGK